MSVNSDFIGVTKKGNPIVLTDYRIKNKWTRFQNGNFSKFCLKVRSKNINIEALTKI